MTIADNMSIQSSSERSMILAKRPQSAKETSSSPVVSNVRWSKVSTSGTSPTAREGHSCVVVKHLLLVFGGLLRGRLDELYCLNLKTMRWSKPEVKGVEPVAHCYHSCVVYGNLVIIYGGQNGPQGSHQLGPGTVFILDTERWVWSKQPGGGTLPRNRYAHAAAVSHDKMFVHGGASTGGSQLGDLVCLTLDKLYWSKLEASGSAPGPRQGHTLVSIRHKLILFGGQSLGKNPDLYILNTDSLVWSVGKVNGAVPVGRFGHAASAVGKNMFVFGGRDTRQALNDVYSLDTDTLIWTQHHLGSQGTGPSPRYGHAMANVGNGSLFVMGGISLRTGYCSNEVFSLETDGAEFETKRHLIASGKGSELMTAIQKDARKSFAELKSMDSEDGGGSEEGSTHLEGSDSDDLRDVGEGDMSLSQEEARMKNALLLEAHAGMGFDANSTAEIRKLKTDIVTMYALVGKYKKEVKRLKQALALVRKERNAAVDQNKADAIEISELKDELSMKESQLAEIEERWNEFKLKHKWEEMQRQRAQDARGKIQTSIEKLQAENTKLLNNLQKEQEQRGLAENGKAKAENDRQVALQAKQEALELKWELESKISLEQEKRMLAEKAAEKVQSEMRHMVEKATYAGKDKDDALVKLKKETTLRRQVESQLAEKEKALEDALAQLASKKPPKAEKPPPKKTDDSVDAAKLKELEAIAAKANNEVEKMKKEVIRAEKGKDEAEASRKKWESKVENLEKSKADLSSQLGNVQRSLTLALAEKERAEDGFKDVVDGEVAKLVEKEMSTYQKELRSEREKRQRAEEKAKLEAELRRKENEQKTDIDKVLAIAQKERKELEGLKRQAEEALKVEQGLKSKMEAEMEGLEKKLDAMQKEKKKAEAKAKAAEKKAEEATRVVEEDTISVSANDKDRPHKPVRTKSKRKLT